jgi:hypothetical protein
MAVIEASDGFMGGQTAAAATVLGAGQRRFSIALDAIEVERRGRRQQQINFPK